MTKMLHELIKLAKEGKKFTVVNHSQTVFDQNNFRFETVCWSPESVVTPWTDYKEEREPMVIWVNIYDGYVRPHTSKESAECNATKNAIRIAVKFVEVVS